MKIKLRELAKRIDTHLNRFEADKTGVNKPDKPRGLHPYYNSGAFVAGCYVRVRYISYQGASSLTKEQAARYLEALDNGYVGKHHELFRREKEGGAT